MSGKIKNFIEEFKAFALRGNMMDMAVGIIIGGAFTGNPILNFVTGAETYTLQNVAGFASSFVSELVNFFIMAFVLFLLLKGMNKLVALGKKPEAPAAPTTKVCPFCQSEIPIAATRCPHCTSKLEEAEKQEAVAAAE